MTNKFIFPILLGFLLSGCGADTPSEEITYPGDIANGSFEDGLTGWTIGGLGGFTEDDVSELVTLPDGKPSLKVGTKFYAGATSSLASFTGTLTSDPFALEGIGVISLKIGAAENPDKTYIEFYKVDSDVPLDFYVNNSSDKVSKLTNGDFNSTTVTSQLMRNIVDLSEYLTDAVYIKITDADTNSDYGDYSFWNLDDFKVLKTAQEKNDALVERSDQLLEYYEVSIDNDPPVETLRNGGFELGDTSYWKVVSGQAFSGDILKNSTDFYWGNRVYHAEGNYLIDNFADESLIGKMRSEKFLVTDQGDDKSFVSLKMGGAANSSVYVSINDAVTGSELLIVRNEGFSDPGLALSLITYYVDVSAYIGSTLYFCLVDQDAVGPFGALVADDFRINLSQNEVIDEVAGLRSWAATLTDTASQADYIAAYNGGLSFPIGGSAPTIALTDGLAYETTIETMTTSLLNFLNYISVSDDYTKTSALVKTIDKVSYDGAEVNNPNLSSFTLLEGTYLLDISVQDAYANKTSSQIKINVVSELAYDNQIVNGDFETGDLGGWSVVSGSVNTTAAISNATTFWAEEIPYNKQGQYFFNGWDTGAAEASGYGLRSSTFTLGGSGQISFKMGGRSSVVKVYFESGELIATYRNYKFNSDGTLFPLVKNGSMLATMSTYVADLNQYIGDNMYIEIIDEVIAQDWAVAFFDDVKTYYEDEIDIADYYDTVTQNGEEVHLPFWAAQAA